MSRDWDASTYERVSNPQVEWAREVLDRLPLRGDETVLDAGCGSGRVTQMLLERLPRGHVVAVDAAPSMVEAARKALDGRATVIQSDLLELELDEPVDAAFSNAVFHWVPDHDRLFERLHAALRPGGRVSAQCGGKGNIHAFHALADGVAAEPPSPSTWRAGPARGASPAPRTRATSSRRPASSTSRRRSSRGPYSRPSRASTSAPCASATTWNGFPPSCATAMWTRSPRAPGTASRSTTCG